MAIKNDPNNSDAFIVTYAKRHPKTGQPVTRRKAGVKTRAEAERTYKKMIIDVEEKIHRTSVPTWGTVITEYLEACRNRGLMEKTIYDTGVCLDAHTFGAWGRRLIDTITTMEIRELLVEKCGARAQSHQRYMLKCIRSVFNHAVEAAYIQRNPTPQLQFKVGDKIQKVLTEDQAILLIRKSREQKWKWHPHYVLALYTGMRNGELYALRWENVDLDRKTILVNCAWNSKDGFKSTKSGDDRMIEVAPGLLPVLRELYEQRDGSSYVLPHLYEWQKGEQARQLATFLGANGLPEVRFHDLRATWATMLLGKGVEPIKVMKMGGWKDLETMMIYARKAGIDIRGAMDCLNLHSAEGAEILRLATV